MNLSTLILLETLNSVNVFGERRSVINFFLKPVCLLMQLQKGFNDSCGSRCFLRKLALGQILLGGLGRPYTPLILNFMGILIVPMAWQLWGQFQNSAKALSELRDPGKTGNLGCTFRLIIEILL